MNTELVTAALRHVMGGASEADKALLEATPLAEYQTAVADVLAVEGCIVLPKQPFNMGIVAVKAAMTHINRDDHKQVVDAVVGLVNGLAR